MKWFQRMNPRERILSLIVAGALFLLVNFLICDALLGMLSRARADVAARKGQRAQQSAFLKERKTWEKRAAWLEKNQPTMKSPAEASTLLEEVQQIAGKHTVLLENPQLGSGDSTANHQGVSASVETRSPWPPLVHFLYDVQQPEKFIVFESVNLQIDGADPTMMRGKFKIARWFAPKQGGQPK